MTEIEYNINRYVFMSIKRPENKNCISTEGAGPLPRMPTWWHGGQSKTKHWLWICSFSNLAATIGSATLPVTPIVSI